MAYTAQCQTCGRITGPGAKVTALEVAKTHRVLAGHVTTVHYGAGTTAA